MPTYNAAYCSACGAYVLVSVQGGCVFGHPRSNLRGIYAAEIDRRTGNPKAPTTEQRAASLRPTAPVAPIALPADAPPAARWPVGESVPEWPAQGPVATGAPASPQASGDSPRSDPASANAPLAPVMSAMGSRMPRALLLSDMHAVLGRLFGPPRGRHSAGVAAIGPPRGRHSAK